jgi:hypothetical protein
LVGPENFALENCCYASHLGYSDSPREKTRILGEISKAKGDCNKTDSNMWLNQVEDKWDKILFEQALNWEGPKLPEEAKKKLSGALESSGVGGVSWISLQGEVV